MRGFRCFFGRSRDRDSSRDSGEQRSCIRIVSRTDSGVSARPPGLLHDSLLSQDPLSRNPGTSSGYVSIFSQLPSGSGGVVDVVPTATRDGMLDTIPETTGDKPYRDTTGDKTYRDTTGDKTGDERYDALVRQIETERQIDAVNMYYLTKDMARQRVMIASGATISQVYQIQRGIANNQVRHPHMTRHQIMSSMHDRVVAGQQRCIFGGLHPPYLAPALRAMMSLTPDESGTRDRSGPF